MRCVALKGTFSHIISRKYHVYLISCFGNSPYLFLYNAPEQYAHIPCQETIMFEQIRTCTTITYWHINGPILIVFTYTES